MGVGGGKGKENAWKNGDVIFKATEYWVKGNKGATCKQTCESRGLACNAEVQTSINSYDKIRDAFKQVGVTCLDKDIHRTYAGTPFTREDRLCVYMGSGGKSTCTG